MPSDRTVCPDCRNRPADREGCRTCGGSGAVCPLCRGARWIVTTRSGANAGRIRHCDCTLPDAEGRHRPDVHREVTLILAYRERLRREDALADLADLDDDPPF